MKASEAVVDRQTVQRLLFARLLVRTKRALTREEVVKSVAQVLSPPLTAWAARDAVRAELERSERSGWVADSAAARAGSQAQKGARRSQAGRADSGKKVARSGKRAPRLGLTPKAQALAFALFGGESMPEVRSWEHGRQLVALSQIGRASAAGKTLHVDALAAVILAERTSAPPELEKLGSVIDYLAWRELGVETTAPFEIDAVQRYLLRRIVPHDVRVNQTTWRRMLAMRVARGDSPDLKGLIRALLIQKPKGRGSALRTQPKVAAKKGATPVANDNAPRPRAQPTLADFAAAVREAAALPNVARYHDDRAFIGSVWEQMRGRGLLGSMSLDEFKARLIAAHRDGLLRITRADLVAAMDPNELERSEARYQNATFHFVALEAGGSR